MFSDQLDTRQLDAIYHSETRFRWKYVSEMASSVCYNAVANIFERLAKRSIVVTNVNITTGIIANWDIN